MLFRPDLEDLRRIGRVTGLAVAGVGALMVPAAGTAAALGERHEALAFVTGAGLALCVGGLVFAALRGRGAPRSTHGLAALALSWPLCAFFAAVPLAISGHWSGFGDAWFEAVSGLTASGLTLVNDVDHLPVSIDLWRHALQLVGAYAITVVAVTVIAGGGRALGAFHATDEPEEHIGANSVRAARVVGRVFGVWAVAGVVALWVAVLQAGLAPAPALRHAASLFSSAFSTGGFTVHSTSLAFYRSPLVEAIAVVLMLAGAVGVPLHVLLHRRQPGDLLRGLEPRTFALTLLGVFAVLAIGLVRTGTIESTWPLWRAGFVQTVAAHTTSGLRTVPGRLVLTDWGQLAPAMLVTAMALGGMAASAAGGIKSARLGLVAKGLGRDLRKVLLPEDAVITASYQAGLRRRLVLEHVRGAAVIVFLFFLLYLATGLLGLTFGYSLDAALFDGVAAASTSGLSVGVVRPGMEWGLELAYGAAMVVGRLEFLAVLTLAGYAVSFVRGRV